MSVTDESSVAPNTYEELIQLIHDRYDRMSKAYQKIAVYLTQNPNDVAVLSVGAIADQCAMHASNLVRFAQALGFTGFKELQQLFRARLTTAAPGFDARIRALESELGGREDHSELGFLRMWSIHPTQVQPIVDAMKPDLGEVADAAQILLAAQRAQWGPIRYEGELHDRATYRYFWQLLQKARVTGVELPEEAALAFFR